VLSFGGSKNGAMGADALIVMNAALAASARFQRKQQMQLASKMRFLAAQFSALLEDQIWLRNARHANAMARRLADGVSGVPGVRLHQAVESNGVFAVVDLALIEALQREWTFGVWDDREHVVRWMTAFDTTEDDIDAFVSSIRAAAGAITA
jgi:threonine aldolase